jgi:predicted methyltransferase
MKHALLASLASVSLVLVAGCGARPGSSGGAASPVQNTGVVVPSGAQARAAAVLAEKGRPQADRAQDGPRQAADVLAYLNVTPGTSVAVLAPGSGYFMELLARSVGQAGRIFARNPPLLVTVNGLRGAWDERLGRPIGARVVRIDADLGTPLPVQALDLVFLDYDFAALKENAIVPSSVTTSAWYGLGAGGRFVVVARETEVGGTRREIEGQGFRFASEGDFLRDGASPCDWSDSSPEHGATAPPSKRVFLTFEKP